MLADSAVVISGANLALLSLCVPPHVYWTASCPGRCSWLAALRRLPIRAHATTLAPLEHTKALYPCAVPCAWQRLCQRRPLEAFGRAGQPRPSSLLSTLRWLHPPPGLPSSVTTATPAPVNTHALKQRSLRVPAVPEGERQEGWSAGAERQDVRALCHPPLSSPPLTHHPSYAEAGDFRAVESVSVLKTGDPAGFNLVDVAAWGSLGHAIGFAILASGGEPSTGFGAFPV